VLNVRDVWRSSLLLAKDAEANDSGVFTVADLSRLHLPQTRLVVLAACDTAGSDTAVSDGVPALLVPLLAAGVPSLVASLWEVDDAASSLLFEEFHRRVASGESPVIALREAKLLLIHSPEASLRVPTLWAPFTLVGGVKLNL
jgi:CHAT domain-containing protein